MYGAQKGRLVLIDADLLHRACDKRMGNFDRLPLQERRNLMRP